MVLLCPSMRHLLRDAVSGEVRAQLARRRLRQADLAPVLGVNQGQVSKRLCGHVPWSVDDLEALAEFFGVDARDLVPGLPDRADVDIPDHRGEAGARRRHPTAANSAAVRSDRVGAA